MRVSLRWDVILFLAFVTACAPAVGSSVLSVTRLPDYVDALEVEATVSGLAISVKTNVRDDVCLRTRLLQDDQPVVWWPDECFFAFGGRVRISVPFGKAGVPAALESQARYVFQIEVRDAPAVRDMLAFDLTGPPTSIAASNTKPPPITTRASTLQVTVTPVATPSPIPTFDASLPFARYLSGNELIEQDARGGQRMLVTLPEAGEIKQAVQVNDDILIWRAQGIQRVSLKSGQVALVVPFDKPALFGFGNLVAAPNGRTVVYAFNEADACTDGAPPTIIGQYRLDTGSTRTLFITPEPVWLIGLAGDGGTMYLQPVSCDGLSGELWAVSLLTGKVSATLPAKDNVNGYLSQKGASTSPSSRFITFPVRPVGDVLGMYDLGLNPPQLTWLAIPSNIAWLEDTRWLYYLRDNTLFRYELTSGESVELGKVPANATRLRYATGDGNWLVLTDKAMSTLVFFDLKQSIALEAALPAEQPVVLVMPQ